MKVAIAQIAPVLFDRAATLDRVLAAISEAANNNATLVTFGECLVPAYPLWLCRTDAARFEADDQKELHALYLEQAVCIENGHLDGVRAAASKHGITVILGIAERPVDRGQSIYCSRVIIEPKGHIHSVHRKLMPTYEERLSWAAGDGAGLRTCAVGEFTVGALNCWENWMPLARAALYGQGETLHVMLWPGDVKLTADLTRFVAREGRMFVMSSSAIIRPSDVPDSVPYRDRICGNAEVFFNGGSCIAGPDGTWIVEPVVGEEQLLYADLDLADILKSRQSFDPAGHYARPDVLKLTVNRTRQSTVQYED
jgi:nitrilase